MNITNTRVQNSNGGVISNIIDNATLNNDNAIYSEDILENTKNKVLDIEDDLTAYCRTATSSSVVLTRDL